MGKAEAGMAVAMLASAYPAAKFDDAARAELWIRMLEDLQPESLGAAVQKLIFTRTFCPSIAEIREAVVGVSTTVDQTTPAEAWKCVLDEIARVGWCGAPKFGDPLITRAAQCTANWHDLCTTNVDEMPAHRARFIQAYEGLRCKIREGLMLPEGLRAQIAACQREQLRGALDGTSVNGLPRGDVGSLTQ